MEIIVTGVIALALGILAKEASKTQKMKKKKVSVKAKRD